MNIEELKKLAGIDKEQELPQSLENMSHTAQELKDKEKELGLKPGDPEWFKLWFSRPYMSGSIDSKFAGFRGRKKK